MKVLAACLLAIALMLRAAPICAAPVQTDAVTMTADCMAVPDHHDGQGGKKNDDATRSCHACAVPPVAIADPPQSLQVNEVRNFSASTQLAGGAVKPPTPPPRKRSGRLFSKL